MLAQPVRTPGQNEVLTRINSWGNWVLTQTCEQCANVKTGALRPMGGGCEVESAFCVFDRPCQFSVFLCFRLGLTRPTDPPRAARRRKFWVGTTRPTDPPSGQGLFRPGRNDPTDRPTQRPGGSSDRVGRTRPTDPLNSGPATNSGLVRLRLRLGLSGAGSWGPVRVKAKGAGLRAKGHRHLNTGRRRLDS